MVLAPTAEARSRLEHIMEQSLEAANELLRILHDERRALENRDTAALGAAAEGKQDCVRRLEALEASRRTEDELPAPVAEGWQGFLAVIRRCNDLNASNGAIIRLRREQLAAAARLLGGRSTETYGPSGCESPSSAGRALAAV